MTEIEKAIKDFENFKQAGYTHCELPSSWHIELAISALRAQQARENLQPLSLEELREMDGQPVWVHELTKTPIDGDYWGIVCVGYRHEHWDYSDGAIISNPTNGISTVGATPIEEYGITYVAYRHPPKEVQA